MDDYIKAAENAPIKNVRGYMKSVIWTSLSTYKVKFEFNFACAFLPSVDGTGVA